MCILYSISKNKKKKTHTLTFYTHAHTDRQQLYEHEKYSIFLREFGLFGFNIHRSIKKTTTNRVCVIYSKNLIP